MDTAGTLTTSAAVLSSSLLTFALMAGTALADPPANDTSAGAIPVSVGFHAQLNTAEATTDPQDVQFNESGCWAPATDASVWYTFKSASDVDIVVDVSQSNYSAGVLVGVGNPGDLSTINCGPGAVAFTAAANTTYYILAIDSQEDGGGNGGNLDISLDAVVAPKVNISVNRFGQVNVRTGTAIISGSYSCTDGNYFEAYVNARQNIGRVFTVSGDGYFSGSCNEVLHPWSVEIMPSSGKFAGGKAATVSTGYTCGIYWCADGYARQTVQLRGKK